MAIPTPAPTRSGQYASAKLTRATTIGDLAYQKYQSGDDTNVVGSYVQAAREKLRARSVAMKERFDPLNLVQKATGSKILTAAAGRAMGRSSDDVDYFNKKSEEGKKPKGTGGPRDAREREGKETKTLQTSVLKKQDRYYDLVLNKKTSLYPKDELAGKLQELIDMVDKRMPSVRGMSDQESGRYIPGAPKSLSGGNRRGGGLVNTVEELAGTASMASNTGGFMRSAGRLTGKVGRGLGELGKSALGVGGRFLGKMGGAGKALLGVGGAAAAGGAALAAGGEMAHLGMAQGLTGAGSEAAGAAAKATEGVGTKVATKGAEEIAAAGAKTGEKSVGKAIGKKIEKGAIKTLLQKTALKAVPKLIGKSIPIVGALGGLGFAVGKLLQGDWAGAGIEAASGLGGPITAIPATILGVVNDVYTDLYGVAPGNDPNRGSRFGQLYELGKEVVGGYLKSVISPSGDQKEAGAPAAPEAGGEAGGPKQGTYETTPGTDEVAGAPPQPTPEAAPASAAPAEPSAGQIKVNSAAAQLKQMQTAGTPEQLKAAQAKYDAAVEAASKDTAATPSATPQPDVQSAPTAQPEAPSAPEDLSAQLKAMSDADFEQYATVIAKSGAKPEEAKALKADPRFAKFREKRRAASEAGDAALAKSGKGQAVSGFDDTMPAPVPTVQNNMAGLDKSRAAAEASTPSPAPIVINSGGGGGGSQAPAVIPPATVNIPIPSATINGSSNRFEDKLNGAGATYLPGH